MFSCYPELWWWKNQHRHGQTRAAEGICLPNQISPGLCQEAPPPSLTLCWALFVDLCWKWEEWAEAERFMRSMSGWVLSCDWTIAGWSQQLIKMNAECCESKKMECIVFMLVYWGMGWGVVGMNGCSITVQLSELIVIVPDCQVLFSPTNEGRPVFLPEHVPACVTFSSFTSSLYCKLSQYVHVRILLGWWLTVGPLTGFDMILWSMQHRLPWQYATV